ncbi:MBL fold metallo-hydrolase [Martelella mediterranea]|uniref:MBL fold metallo-hydrolase n=1 Tax=Martelella mediterranea TaxID=293089 RepID=UPI001E48BCA6|nr:MBL fold metallo-hydrolase [Martelella mediterranea]MCD1635797.1 MBL fold metallo-hydrolase [Martelella mediterranea]
MEEVKRLAEPVSQIYQALTPEVPLYLHVIRGDDCAAIIDGGMPNSSEYINRLLERTGVGRSDKPLQYLLNTHGHHDHIGNFPRLKKEHGALVVTVEDAVPWIEDTERNLREFALHHPHIIGDGPDLRAELEPTYSEGVRVDLTLTEGSTVRLGGGIEIEAISLPGHLEAELGWFERHTKMLVLGDAVIGIDWPIFHGHAKPAVLRQSLRKLRSFVADRDVTSVAMSHYHARGADEFLELVEEVLTFIDRTEQVIREQIGRRPVTLEQVWQGTCKAMGKAPEFRSLMMVDAHIHEFLHAYEIERVGPETYQRIG